MFALNAILSIPANRKCSILLVELISSAANMACRNDLKPHVLTQKNALYGRFFIPLILILISLPSHADNHLNQTCVSTHFDEKAHIDYVIDGDTVVLKDKRHVRLIGINTPEIGHNKKPSEAGAIKARTELIKLLQAQPSIQLLYEQERYDRHGRTLAHLFLNDGTNIQAELLKFGLAMPLRIPPNLLYADCYNLVGQFAKESGHGLWMLSRYKIRDVSSLNGNEKGFYFITGQVKRVSKSQSAIWLNLNNNVTIKISRDDLRYFNNSRLESLKDKNIEASGWLYPHKGQLRMRLRYQLDLNLAKTQD